MEDRQAGISRRAFLTTASLGAAGLAVGRPVLAAVPGSAVVVSTRAGDIRGQSLQNGVNMFRGIPYAEPPVKGLRFRKPIRLAPWAGVRDASHFAPGAMQSGDIHGNHSEDCLYLNVWAPETRKPLPVLVWVHGGGFTAGRTSDPMLDGAHFALDGVVCVTVAYRLGAFGFLDMEPLLGSSFAGSGNNALRDVILALEWVQDNIAAFGGDPGRITLGGESAGAKIGDILTGVPSARLLFHQVISESGGAERVFQASDAATVANGFGELWQHRAPLHSLLTAPAYDVIHVQDQFLKQWPEHFPLRCSLDGDLIPVLPVRAMSRGGTRGKRLLLGTNRDESAMFIGPHPARNAQAADLGNLSLERFAEVCSHYPDVYPQMTEEQRRIRALSAEEYWVPSIRMADAFVQGGGSAFMYRLDFTESSGPYRGLAFHSLDLRLVWNSPNSSAANMAQEVGLARQIHDAWVSFISGHRPAASGLPEWVEYAPSTRPTMVLDTKSHIERQPQEAELRLWQNVL